MVGKRSKSIGLMALMALAGAVFGAIVAYIQLAPADKVPANLRRDTEIPTTPPITGNPTPSQEQIKVYIPTAQGEDVAFRTQSEAVPKGENPMVFAVNRFLSESKIAEPTARLLSVDLKENVATLSFNAAFNQTMGSLDEEVFLRGLRQTMGQFAGVEKIMFLADGQPVETLGGVELTDGLTVLP